MVIILGYYFDLKGPDRKQIALVAEQLKNRLQEKCNCDTILATDDLVILSGDPLKHNLYFELFQTKTVGKLYFKADLHIGNYTEEFLEWNYPSFEDFCDALIEKSALFYNKKIKIIRRKKAFKGMETEFVDISNDKARSLCKTEFYSFLLAIVTFKTEENECEYDFRI